MLAGAGQAGARVEAFHEAPKAVSIGAFVITGPETMTAENTQDWLRDRFDKDSSRPGHTALGAACGPFAPSSAKPLLHVGVGPSRFVAVRSFSKPADKITTYKFILPQSRNGPGWRLAPNFAAISLTDLKGHLDAQDAGVGGSLGSRILAAAIGQARRASVS